MYVFVLYALFMSCVFVHFTHFHKSKRQDVQTDCNMQLKVNNRNKHTHTCTFREWEREEIGGKSALSHFWICHFATTVNVTFANGKPGIRCRWGWCVYVCWMCVTVSVHMLSVRPDLLWLDQYYCLQSVLQGVRPCLVFPQHALPITWSLFSSKLIKDDVITALHSHTIHKCHTIPWLSSHFKSEEWM